MICEDLGAEPLLVGCEDLYDALVDYGSKIIPIAIAAGAQCSLPRR